MFIYNLYNNQDSKGGQKKMILSISEYFDDIEKSIINIKDIIVFFYDAVTMVFNLIPEPFGVILRISLLIVTVIIIRRLLKGS